MSRAIPAIESRQKQVVLAQGNFSGNPVYRGLCTSDEVRTWLTCARYQLF